MESAPRGPPAPPRSEASAAEGPSGFCGHAAKVRANGGTALLRALGFGPRGCAPALCPPSSLAVPLGCCPCPPALTGGAASPVTCPLAPGVWAERGWEPEPPPSRAPIWGQRSTETSVAARSRSGSDQADQVLIPAQPTWIVTPPARGLLWLKWV